jgi:DNA-binding transcriptional ArsR family regulator
MRALYHPSIEDVTVETVFHALSDPVRVAIFEQIAGSDCQQTCSNFLVVRNHAVPKSTLSQHFKVLREAGLIRSERHGVEMHSTSRCREIENRFPGLIPSIIRALRIQAGGKSAVQHPPRRSSRRSQL